MNSQALQLALFVLSEAIRQYPAIRAAIADVFSKENPTPEDWQALHDRIAAKGYFDYVPDSALLPGSNPLPGPFPPVAPPPHS